MSCEGIEERLDAYLDGTLDAAEAAETSAHLGSCLACFRRLAARRRIRDGVRDLPREIEPARDLWSDIESRLDRRASRAPRVALGSGWRWALAAALAAAVAVPLWLARGGPEEPTPTTAAPRAVVLETAAMAARARSEDGALQIREDLMAAIERRRGQIAPAALESLEEGARAIDTAIAQIRAALEEHPDDRRLGLRLAARYRQERRFLQRISSV